MARKNGFNRHHQMAVDAMEKFPNTRNDDLELFFVALFQKGVFVPVEIREKIKKSEVNFKTLIRERQKLQAQGKYPPTRDDIMQRRGQRASDFSEHYSQNSLKLD